MPSAAACHQVGLAPRSTSRRAAFQFAKTTASDSGAPPVKIAPVASMFAPASSSASTAATSLLLAAQCSGVSTQFGSVGCGDIRALTSAPAAASAAIVAATLG